MNRIVLTVGLVALLFSSSCAGRVPAMRAADRAEVRVVMYTTTWCPVCQDARSWFHRRGIPFEEYDVESDRGAMARMRQLNAAGTVPTIDVEGRVVVGFVSEHLRQVVDRAAHRHCVEARGEAACSDDR